MRIVRRWDSKGLQARIAQQVSIAELQWAQVVISHASAHAPILSGQLRRSLTHTDVKVTGGIMGVRYTILVGPDETVKSYAARQEFDTDLGFGPISAAEGATRPWLRPAFDASKTLGRALVRAAFQRAIR